MGVTVGVITAKPGTRGNYELSNPRYGSPTGQRECGWRELLTAVVERAAYDLAGVKVGENPSPAVGLKAGNWMKSDGFQEVCELIDVDAGSFLSKIGIDDRLAELERKYDAIPGRKQKKRVMEWDSY